MSGTRHLILQEINFSLEITSNSKAKAQPCRKVFPQTQDIYTSSNTSGYSGKTVSDFCYYLHIWASLVAQW